VLAVLAVFGVLAVKLILTVNAMIETEGTFRGSSDYKAAFGAGAALAETMGEEFPDGPTACANIESTFLSANGIGPSHPGWDKMLPACVEGWDSVRASEADVAPA
jgi:hypothetical protein